MCAMTVQVRFKQGSEKITVRLGHKDLVNVPVQLLQYDGSRTLPNWEELFGRDQIVRSLFGQLKGLVEKDEWEIPRLGAGEDGWHEMTVLYPSRKAESLVRLLEQCYITSAESGRHELAVHLASFLPMDSLAYVLFKSDNGLEASFTKREIAYLGFCRANEVEVPDSMKTLVRVFDAARDSLMNALYEAMPEWYGFTDDEASRAHEEAFIQATEWFCQDPLDFWASHSLNGLHIEKTVGLGPDPTVVSDRVCENLIETEPANDPLDGLAECGRVIILLEGGLVQEVFSNQPLDVMVFDRDIEGADEDEISTPEDIRALLKDVDWRPVGCDRYLVEQPVDFADGKGAL